MNCCDEYGNCNQGRNCPARATNSKPSLETKSDVMFHLVSGIVIFAWVGWIAFLAMLAITYF